MRGDADPVPAFLEFLAAERGASAHTLRGYAGDLAELQAYLRSVRVSGLAAADARVLRGYLAWLHGRGLAKSSIARKVACARSCYRFLARRELVATNPARQLASPRLPRRLPSVLPKDESKELLDAPARGTDLHHTIAVSFEDAVRGGQHSLTVTRQGQSVDTVSAEPGLDILRRQPDGTWKIVNKLFAHTGGEPPEMG